MIDRIVRTNYRLSHRMRRKAHKVTREQAGLLARSLQRAGLTGPVPISMRRAAWRRAYGWNLFGAMVLLLGAMGLSRGSIRLARLLFPAAVPVVRGLFLVIGVAVISWILMYIFISSTRVGWLGIIGKFVPVKSLEDVVTGCATVLAAGPRSRPDHLAGVPPLMRYAEQYVLKMYRQRGTVPRFSHRGPQLRAHARLVAARLRAAEARLDVDAEGAAREIASLVVQIADNYVAGRVGALLPEEELKDLQPVRDYTTRLLPSLLSMTRLVAAAAVVAALAGAGTWAASRFGIPPSLAALPAIALASVLVPALVSIVTPQAK
ncbi:hypothetical protein ABZW10_14520 [Kitasatospora sp. NPDC004723]|uniref:hypothetical protein n=1 Tax=Kitasatospora sp. NPDC004723 TaxID=3154288 RepID=UPI0033A41F2D